MEVYKKFNEIPDNLITCLECNKELTKDIYQITKEKGKGRLIEAICCDDCKLIYKIIED